MTLDTTAPPAGPVGPDGAGPQRPSTGKEDDPLADSLPDGASYIASKADAERREILSREAKTRELLEAERRAIDAELVLRARAQASADAAAAKARKVYEGFWLRKILPAGMADSVLDLSRYVLEPMRKELRHMEAMYNRQLQALRPTAFAPTQADVDWEAQMTYQQQVDAINAYGVYNPVTQEMMRMPPGIAAREGPYLQQLIGVIHAHGLAQAQQAKEQKEQTLF